MKARYSDGPKWLGLVGLVWLGFRVRVWVRVRDWTVGIAGLRNSGHESLKRCRPILCLQQFRPYKVLGAVFFRLGVRAR